MIDDWQCFDGLVRAWVANGVRDPALPSTPEDFLALGYEKWLAVQTATGGRRTLELFETLLKGLYDGETVPSLYRKVKGTIRPRETELLRLLTALFARLDDEEHATVADRKSVEPFTRDLADRLSNRQPDLVEDAKLAWLFASQGNLIFGPNDHTRDDTFRDVMANRLHATRDELARSNASAVPLTLWVVDASGLWDGAELAYDTRRALTTLASSLMAALATKLLPPREMPSLEFSADKSTNLPPNVRIGLRRKQSSARDETDLREDLLRTSVICLVGLPPEYQPPHDGALEMEGDFGENFFSQALMPSSIVTYDNLVESVADRETISRIIELTSRHEVCLGTKVELARVRDISACISDDVGTLDDVQDQIALEPRHYVYWYEEKQSGERKSEVPEQFLQRVVTPRAIRIAIFSILAAAATRLAEEQPGGKPLRQGTIGRELTDLLSHHGVRILTIREFLDFKSWFDPQGKLLDGAKPARQKE